MVANCIPIVPGHLSGIVDAEHGRDVTRFSSETGSINNSQSLIAEQEPMVSWGQAEIASYLASVIDSERSSDSAVRDINDTETPATEKKAMHTCGTTKLAHNLTGGVDAVGYGE